MLMSKAEYAKHKGVSRQTVYDWIEKGEVVMSGKKIDVEATEQRNSPPAQGKDTVSEMWYRENAGNDVGRVLESS